MSRIAEFIEGYEFNRGRTLALLRKIESAAAPDEALAWRPGPGRAHIGWQLMHIGITEEIFATERLGPGRSPKWPELWGRFRGGSTPDENVPSLPLLQEVLAGSRVRLIETLSEYDDARLSEIPAALAERKLTLLEALHLIGWHEAHHQGQAHLTLNLYQVSGG